jgi:hypothetical protein
MQTSTAMSERRASTRTPTSRWAVFRHAEGDDTPHQARISDLSKWGARMDSPLPEPVGTVLTVEMAERNSTQESSRPIETKATVVRVEPTQSKGFVLGLRLQTPEFAVSPIFTAPVPKVRPRQAKPDAVTIPPRENAVAVRESRKGRKRWLLLLLLLLLLAWPSSLLVKRLFPPDEWSGRVARAVRAALVDIPTGGGEKKIGKPEADAEQRLRVASTESADVTPSAPGKPGRMYNGLLGGSLRQTEPPDLSHFIRSDDALASMDAALSSDDDMPMNPGIAGQTFSIMAMSGDDSGLTLAPVSLGRTFRESAPVRIEIRVRTHSLSIVQNGRVVRRFPVGTGLGDSTPRGVFRIADKVERPTWFGLGVPVAWNNPSNPLGKWWMGLGASAKRPRSGHGIHDTRDLPSVGKSMSRGCVRLRPADMGEVFARCPVGTPVTICD